MERAEPEVAAGQERARWYDGSSSAFGSATAQADPRLADMPPHGVVDPGTHSALLPVSRGADGSGPFSVGSTQRSPWSQTAVDGLGIHYGEALPFRRRLEALVRSPKLDRSAELRA